jgi:geranylgeranyl diphosphate synthase type II
VAYANGDDRPEIADSVAAAIEILHCASLVHDDLPCFDNAETRRGLASVHRAFGEPIAVLAGDALIVLSFEFLALSCASEPQRLGPLIKVLGQSVGGPTGICAGQAWESESVAVLQDYHRAKTGSLFVAATVMGSLAAGADPEPWRMLGESLGEAYQVADDIKDLVADEANLGKPTGQDQLNNRPNAIDELGVDGAMLRLRALVGQAADSIPQCPGRSELEALVMNEAKRLTPKKRAVAAA